MAISARSRSTSVGSGEDPAEGPGERRSRGLVAGDQQRPQLVVNLVFAEGSARLVACVEHHGEDVASSLGPVCSPVPYFPAQDLARAPRVTSEAPPWAEAPEVALHEREEEPRPRRDVEPVGQRVGELAEAGAGDAEDGADDDLERDRLHRPVDREPPPEGVPVDRLVRDVEHRASVGVHALAVERGEHHLALAEVLGAVEEEERVLAEERLEHEVRLAGVPLVRAESEDLLHDLGVGDHDDGGSHAG